MGEDLTPRQWETLRIIRGAIRASGRPPTLRELGNVLGIRSTNGVSDHLKALERKGYIRRSPLISRGLDLSTQAYALFARMDHKPWDEPIRGVECGPFDHGPTDAGEACEW